MKNMKVVLKLSNIEDEPTIRHVVRESRAAALEAAMDVLRHVSANGFRAGDGAFDFKVFETDDEVEG